MRIYVDEAGGFVVPLTNPHSFSLVLSLIVPSAHEANLFDEFVRLRDSWSKQEIEIKGSSLDESQAAQIIDLLVRYDLMADFVAVDMGTHSNATIDEFKAQQADNVIACVTPQPHPSMIRQFQDLARTIREMPNKLFVQAIITIDLIFEILQNVPPYFAQRQPKELGDIAWTIDRKNLTITKMEEMWSTLILPISETKFAKLPMMRDVGDFSYYDGRYGISENTTDAATARHIEWMKNTYPVPTGKLSLINLKSIVTEQRSFSDSRDSLGLQLADMLATILRRALNCHMLESG